MELLFKILKTLFLGRNRYLNFKYYFKNYGRKMDNLKLTKEGIYISKNKIQVFGVSPWHTLVGCKEILIDREYDFIDQSNYIMIDIGLNIGITSLHFAMKNNIRKIYAYEPFKFTYDQALNNFELNQSISSKIIPNNFGLSNKNEQLDFFYNKKLPGAMSTTREVFNNEKLEKEKVVLKDVKKVLEPIFAKHDEKIFVKMDCEGAEYLILPRLNESKLLTDIDVIVLEWHKGNPMDLIKILNENDFICFTEGSLNAELGKIRAIKSKTIKNKYHV